MTQQITVSLSDRAYRRVKQWADARRQDVGEAIVDFLDENLPNTASPLIPPATADADVEQEKAAYLRLYPHLKAEYESQYVAIHGGQLVDHDVDYGALFERIDEKYPDSFVWLTRVEDKPMRTIRARSPRFVKDTA
jgi:hypothetical protein